MKTIVNFVIVLAAMGLLTVGGLWFFAQDENPGTIPPLNPPAPTALPPAPTPFLPTIAMPAPIVLQKIETAGELVLVKMEISTIVTVAQENESISFIGFDVYRPENSYVYLLAEGTVRAGYPSNGFEATVDPLNNTLTLYVPAPRIYSYDFDANTSALEFHTAKEISIATLGAINATTMTQVNQLARSQSLTEACNRNIYAEVEAQAEPFFNEWFGQVFDEIILEFAGHEACQ